MALPTDQGHSTKEYVLLPVPEDFGGVGVFGLPPFGIHPAGHRGIPIVLLLPASSCSLEDERRFVGQSLLIWFFMDGGTVIWADGIAQNIFGYRMRRSMAGPPKGAPSQLVFQCDVALIWMRSDGHAVWKQLCFTGPNHRRWKTCDHLDRVQFIERRSVSEQIGIGANRPDFSKRGTLRQRNIHHTKTI